MKQKVCPHCKSECSVPKDFNGSSMACETCGGVFIVDEAMPVFKRPLLSLVFYLFGLFNIALLIVFAINSIRDRTDMPFLMGFMATFFGMLICFGAGQLIDSICRTEFNSERIFLLLSRGNDRK